MIRVVTGPFFSMMTRITCSLKSRRPAFSRPSPYNLYDGEISLLTDLPARVAQSEGELLQVGHHLFHRFDIVLRMGRALEVTDLREVGRHVFRAVAFTRIEAGTQAAFPTHFAHPAAADFEQAGGFFAGVARQVHHQRADQLRLELLEH